MCFDPSRMSAKINKNRPSALWLLAVIVCLSSTAFPQNQSVGGLKPFNLSQLSAAPGTKVSGKLAVNVGKDDVNTFIPVTVIHGRHPGPVLSLIAGIHGSEYAPKSSRVGPATPCIAEPTTTGKSSWSSVAPN